MNPGSAITDATGDRILGDPLVRPFYSAVIREAAAIGEQIGCRNKQSAEDRHALITEAERCRSLGQTFRDLSVRRRMFELAMDYAELAEEALGYEGAKLPEQVLR